MTPKEDQEYRENTAAQEQLHKVLDEVKFYNDMPGKSFELYVQLIHLPSLKLVDEK